MNINITVDKDSQTPLYIQIYQSIAQDIQNGYLEAGDKLPSRRELCKRLNVAQRTIDNAYQKLINDEYIVSRQGSGYYVAAENFNREEHTNIRTNLYNFSTNGVETSKLPFGIWSKILKSVIKENTELFQHGEKAGELSLRKSIRRMLFKTQGIKCCAEQIIIGPGMEDLLRDLFMLFAPDNKILMNNCYHYRVYGMAKDTRIDVEYITNGEEGIDIDELKTHKNGILFQKPTHDLPTCVTLSEQKRLELISWLGENKYVIEDSTENSYQYGTPQKTLWELSGGKNVIYIGSFSKTIAPSMKIGYIVAPEEIVKLWFNKKRFYSNRVSRVEQTTLSQFIDLGHYERHINYMRDVYHEKTLAFKKAVNNSPLGGKCIISGDDVGMYCLIKCDIPITEKFAGQLLLESGVKLSALNSSVYYKSKSTFPQNTYVVGYGNLTISQIREGVALWADALKKYL